MTFLSAPLALKVMGSYSWPSVEGIIEVNQSSSKRIISSKKNKSLTSIRFEVVYEVDGQVYADQSPYLISEGSFAVKSMITDIVTKYPAGSTALVYYNPDDPEVATLERGFLMRYSLFLGIGLMLFLIGFRGSMGPQHQISTPKHADASSTIIRNYTPWLTLFSLLTMALIVAFFAMTLMGVIEAKWQQHIMWGFGAFYLLMLAGIAANNLSVEITSAEVIIRHKIFSFGRSKKVFRRGEFVRLSVEAPGKLYAISTSHGLEQKTILARNIQPIAQATLFCEKINEELR